MQHHLQHYGLFTGGNVPYQSRFKAAESWDRKNSCLMSDSNTQDSNDSASDTEADKETSKKTPYSLLLERALLKTRQLVLDFEGGKQVPRLREPRALFALPTASSPSQSPRWPIECEVLKETVQHIEWEPPEPEGFYQLTGYERAPLCVGEEKGTVVYCIDTAMKSACFTGSRVGGSRGPVKDACASATARDDSLVFESRFETGNLQKAVRVGLHDYELTLRADLYTTRHTQWYYFRVQNMKAGVTYRFTIVNLMKSSSLYGAGMKPLLYSERDAEMRGVGWRRVGGDIRYYRNQQEQEGRSLYSLTWTCQFPHPGDTCYLAHCYPYTYSDLQRYLARLAQDPIRSQHCRFRVLCRSLAGNAVYVLTITSPSPSPAAAAAKRAVVVTARVHPGETNGSWIMRGFLDFLLGDSADARLLRDTFVFKVVPMVNPDGVIVGNYRCSLAGRDLNRNYSTLLRESFPCVWHTRNMVKKLVAERDVILYCDFHGHSRKNNVFMYGCDNKSDPALRLRERVFPLMMSKNAADKFSFKSCKFRVQKGKEGTGRVVMWRMGITNSYTMESTFGGSTLGGRKGTHFTTQDLQSLGYYFCDTLLDYCDPDQAKSNLCLRELCEILQQEIRKKMENLGRRAESDGMLSDVFVSDMESSTSGSNSTESDGLPVHLLSLAHKFAQKKKHLRTRKERNNMRQGRAPGREQKTPSENHSHPDFTALLSEGGMKGGATPGTEKKPDKVLANHRERGRNGPAWIPHPATGITVIGEGSLWDPRQRSKNVYLEAMTAAYLRSGAVLNAARRSLTDVPHLKYSHVKTSADVQNTVKLSSAAESDYEWSSNLCSRHGHRSVTSHRPPLTPQRRPLAITSIRQHCSLEPPRKGGERLTPLRQQPLPFDWAPETGGMRPFTPAQPAARRGRTASAHTLLSSVHWSPTAVSSQVMLSKVMPELPVSRGQYSSGTPAPVQRSAQESPGQPATVSGQDFSHDMATSSSDTMDTSRKRQERDGVAGAVSLDELGTDRRSSKPDSVVNPPVMDLTSFLPDLKKSSTKLLEKRVSRSPSEVADDITLLMSPLTRAAAPPPQQPGRSDLRRERLQRLQKLNLAKAGTRGGTEKRAELSGGWRAEEAKEQAGGVAGSAGGDLSDSGAAPAGT
ncbi:cytosolic carboxypeptidase 2 isoform X2 [Amia ocellicauda]